MATEEKLLELGFNLSLIGSNWLVEAIELCLEDPKRTKKLTSFVYKEVAELNGVNASAVERNIRTSIKSAWKNKNSEAEKNRKKIFGNSIPDDKHPKNGLFIYMIVRCLINEN